MCNEVLLHADLEQKPAKIGGEGKIVEIDEAVWRRRKYHKGKKKKLIWIIGGVVRLEGGGDGDRFMMIVPDRTKETLIPIILDHLKFGTKIYSDKWKAFQCLSTFGYLHETVCHKRKFFNKENKACTNTIEGLWKHLWSSFPQSGMRIKNLADQITLFLVKSSLKLQFKDMMKDLIHYELDELIEDENEIIEEMDEEEIPDAGDTLPEIENDDDFDPLGSGDEESSTECSPSV
ncbi:putative transposase-like protein [Monocercomonoides exilis]|uniref:putative transposase-like protein n=1 Tax=Monocercomonoides exilis TaxID=2049356 RepID=UPI003559B499|nr:putative transposase-like protein [Monocercomonoides exilis]|eukprot:MONOS_6294.1-p1 / transcript=MONOS_6294.1 / gene=MONOS_6294 / organism=Monocercomonoides_exilis_PA203 / gene_product=transposase-like protein HI1328.1 / transcript_product=transposase-like protein HI1328.1 / location=Mono_scaffold00196:36057-36827(-) / protein_length=232 / sequence_SO=supercontig / SO=protein_coding / is_pseudo=false